MKKIGLGILLLIFAQTTLASTPSWTGGYVGLLAGMGFASANTNVSVNTGTGGDPLVSNSINQSGKQTVTTQGLLAGVEAGYNWQMNQGLLFGVESDLQALSLGGRSNSGSVYFPDDSDNNYVIGTYANINWLWTLRPRIGFVHNNWLFFGTAGLGVTQLHANFFYQDSSDALNSGSIDTTKIGPVLGGGVEVKVSEHFSIKGEYLYVYFSGSNATATGASGGTLLTNSQFNYSANFKTNLFRLGLNYYL